MEIELTDFQGCKIALICGDKVLTILRDDKDDIPCPNMWELPGGGREGNESPFDPSVIFEGKQSVFMVGQLRQEQFDNITFGDEGQAYKLMPIEEFLKSKQAVPQLQGRLRDYLEESL